MFGLLSSLFDSGGSSSTPEIKRSGLQNQLNQYVSNNLGKKMPQYQGRLQSQPSQLQNQLTNTMSNRLSGNFGLSDQEKENMRTNMFNNINKQTDEAVTSGLRGMNRRGILSSDITGNAMNKIADTASNAYATAERNIYNQDQNLRRNQMNDAISQAMGMSQLQSSQDNTNINRMLQNWYQQQNLNQLPFQQAMQYLTGGELPFQQIKYNSQMDAQNKQSQKDAGIGEMIGQVLPYIL